MDVALDEQVRVAVYRGFLEEGRPPVPAEIAATLGTTPPTVEAALGRLADAHALVLAPGTPYVWMANPLSAVPTPFQVHARGRQWFGNCIWDGLGVLALLGDDGDVRTWCPDCGDRLAVTVRGGEATGDGVIHFAVPAAQWWDDIGFT